MDSKQPDDVTPLRLAPPRLSDGRPLYFGFIVDSEKGIVTLAAHKVDALELLALLDRARANIDRQWRMGMQGLAGELHKANAQRIVVPSGVLP